MGNKSKRVSLKMKYNIQKKVKDVRATRSRGEKGRSK